MRERKTGGATRGGTGWEGQLGMREAVRDGRGSRGWEGSEE